MKYLPFLLILASCSWTQSAPKQGFEVTAQARRSSVDDQKGIQIMIFPIDQGPVNFNEAK